MKINPIFFLYRFFLTGCFVSGLFLEGAGWDKKNSCLMKQQPRQLIQDLPILKIIPIEAHRLKLQVNIINKLSFQTHFR